MIKPLQTVVAVAAAAAIFAPAALAVDVRSDVRARAVPRMDVKVDVKTVDVKVDVKHASRIHHRGY